MVRHTFLFSELRENTDERTGIGQVKAFSFSSLTKLNLLTFLTIHNHHSNSNRELLTVTYSYERAAIHHVLHSVVVLLLWLCMPIFALAQDQNVCNCNCSPIEFEYTFAFEFELKLELDMPSSSCARILPSQSPQPMCPGLLRFRCERVHLRA